jgi:HAD superfamily hydrolase (TIGR01549 family)
MKDAVKTVVFDWDGTLLDSFPAGYRASVTVLRHFGIDVDRRRFLETYSPNWYDSYQMLGVPETEWDNADRLWRETYREQTSALFPFVKAMLETLRAGGLDLGLVTSGDRERVLRELDRTGLDEMFSAVVCFEDTPEKKPHPAPLARGLDKLGASASSTVYVGDRPEDILMGRRAGTFTIGVESEYGTRAILAKAAPDLLLPDASHLPASFGLATDD